MSEIGTRLDALRAMFGDEGFLQNKGLSNEVGLYIFAYPPEEEMAVRAFVREIRAEYAGEQDKCRVIITIYMKFCWIFAENGGFLTASGRWKSSAVRNLCASRFSASRRRRPTWTK